MDEQQEPNLYSPEVMRFLERKWVKIIGLIVVMLILGYAGYMGGPP